ncbi:MAG: phosphate acyltransferase PlsX [Alphaproteobacteria bacterium]|nr:phosphate acyltransferase PlsX [Alphaproteobacteria bacterium]
MTIALDAMGGDHAPYSIIAGANEVRCHFPNVRYIFFGKEHEIKPVLEQFPALEPLSKIHHTDDVVSAGEKPSVALRSGRNSSMRLAIDAVKAGEAACVVSAGNTGSLMAMSKFVFHTLHGIDRPAIAALMPNFRGSSVILDLGANAECSAENLFQFAIMGEAFAQVVLGKKDPTVGLLNIGSEELKGNEEVKSAYRMLKETDIPINFYGYIEGDAIAKGTVDVIVTDGFTGNVALKTAEGTANVVGGFVKEAFRRNMVSRIGGLLAYPSLKKMYRKIDPRRYNGAMFLGINGISVKSHGGADEISFANAIMVAIELVANQINERIVEMITQKTTATGE